MPRYLKFDILSLMAWALANMINNQIESDISKLSQIIVGPSEFKKQFYVSERKKIIMSCFTRHLSCVTCHMSGVTCYM